MVLCVLPTSAILDLFENLALYNVCSISFIEAGLFTFPSREFSAHRNKFSVETCLLCFGIFKSESLFFLI